jgi:hypothetical protein
MPYFFIHGTMRLGAVYYNPALQDTPVLAERLRQPDLRFAVTYNPTVYHPSFAGVAEPRWWITSPNFHYSPLDRPRRFEPLAQEGKIATKNFHWLEVEVNQPDFPTVLKIQVDNPGEKSALLLEPLSPQGEPHRQPLLETAIPAHWSGWLRLDLGQVGAPPPRFRLLFPAASPDYQISGLAFGDETLNWPWAQRATLTAKPREPAAPAITVSFDARTLLPPPLNQKKLRVLNDTGSSVLLQLDQ